MKLKDNSWLFRTPSTIATSRTMSKATFIPSAASRSEADEIIAFAKRFNPPQFSRRPRGSQTDAVRRPHCQRLAYRRADEMRLYVEHYLTHVASLASPGLDELRWLKPVRPGDRALSVRVTVLKATPSKSKPDRGVVTSFTEVLNQAEEVVMTLKAVNMIARRQ